MRCHEQRAIITRQELFQPDQAFKVEMVARFIQQHDIGPHEQDARQGHAHFPPARKPPHVAIHHLLAEAKAVQHLARPAVQCVTAQFLETGLYLAKAFKDAVKLVHLPGIGHGGFQRKQFGRDLGHRARAVHDFGHGAASGHLAHVLTEKADGGPAIDQDIALVRFVLSRDHAEQGCLARPVGSDQTDLFPLLQGGRGFDKDQPLAIMLGDVV